MSEYQANQYLAHRNTPHWQKECTRRIFTKPRPICRPGFIAALATACMVLLCF